ncbi:carbohydrate kinase family protein [Anaerocolumna xylanovorans]|uniref:Ribokinase n=1 Tax=Anaerocolumna xylanovorans DSM 12503 TaxID=1121345 RepID=A0A1M7YKW3_9FIRM|nr:carbohydrate kinase family protein [Anaerocolumna xylanovorans]SHO53206.1 ribokinase [Anaerocolumna xylanovorans DSM 12503]
MTEKKWDAFIYGDVNVDIIIPGVEKFPEPGQEDLTNTMDTYVGGGAALFTLGLGKLGLKPVFQGSIGEDCYGRFILEEFHKSNVDNSLLSFSNKNKTGISLSFTNEKDRSFLTYRGTNAEINLKDIDLNKVRQARHIHVTGYAGRQNHREYLKLLAEVKKLKSVSISFDVGWDASGEWYEGIYELFPFIDVLFMNETEAIHYGRKAEAGEAIKDFAARAKIAVAKLGKKGSIAYSGSEFCQAAPYQVKAADTTGAGDSFNAGFIYGYLKGKSLTECLLIGNACGALSVTAYGGNTAFPSENRLYEFMEEQKGR